MAPATGSAQSTKRNVVVGVLAKSVGLELAPAFLARVDEAIE
jgi:hypothetical protein